MCSLSDPQACLASGCPCRSLDWQLECAALHAFLLLDLLWFLLIGILFGTTLQELFGKVLGLGRVTEVGSDVVVHFIGRVHLLQERSERGNCGGQSQTLKQPIRNNPCICQEHTANEYFIIQIKKLEL